MVKEYQDRWYKPLRPGQQWQRRSALDEVGSGGQVDLGALHEVLHDYVWEGDDE